MIHAHDEVEGQVAKKTRIDTIATQPANESLFWDTVPGEETLADSLNTQDCTQNPVEALKAMIMQRDQGSLIDCCNSCDH
jgi:hypothetical protein